jgi:hypothetical protein
MIIEGGHGGNVDYFERNYQAEKYKNSSEFLTCEAGI